MLNPSDQKHLEHAQGFFELDMFEDALAELDRIDSPYRTDPSVLSVRLAVYFQTKRWSIATEVARHLTILQPEESAWAIQLAYATRRSESIEAAREILLEAEKSFPKEA